MLNFYSSINLFTDASVVRLRDYNEVASAGYAITMGEQLLESGYRIIDNASNNYGELYAIYLGINNLQKYIPYKLPMNLYSDSLASIKGLKEFVFRWIQDGNYNLINSSGCEVVDQELYINIINQIVKSNLKLQMYHVLGHMDPSYDDQLNRAWKHFEEENGIVLTEDMMRNLCYYNSYVDNMSREKLKSSLQDPSFLRTRFKKKIVSALEVLDTDILNQYAGLIN